VEDQDVDDTAGSDPMKAAPAHIGIVACSAEGAALCYRRICAEGPAVLGAATPTPR
jgi:aspartate racemase